MLRDAPRAIDCCGRTVRGVGRTDNQDRFLIAHLSKSMLVSESNTRLGNRVRLFGGSQGHVLLVADGLGDAGDGPSGAEIATEAMAQQFVDSVPWFFGLDVDHPARLESALESAVARCHVSVGRAGAEAGGRVVGTTMTAAYVLWPRMYLVHLGDSRAYLVRGDEARRLTTDHVRRVQPGDSLEARVPDLARDGEGASEARELLTNALGAGIQHPSAEFSRIDLELGDRVVLCTSGLTKSLDERRMLRQIADAPSATEASEALIAAAQERRASDDATVVVAHFAPSESRNGTRDEHSIGHAS